MLQFGASLTDDTWSVNYDRSTFIIQATSSLLKNILQNTQTLQLFTKIIETEIIHKSFQNAKWEGLGSKI